MPKTKIICALLVAIGLLNLYMNLRPDWTKKADLYAKTPYVHKWAYSQNLIDFGNNRKIDFTKKPKAVSFFNILAL